MRLIRVRARSSHLRRTDVCGSSLGCRSILIFSFLVLAISQLHAAPCLQLKTSPQQDKWVALKVNALVSSARIAYADDDARSRYERAVKSISNQLETCGLNKNPDFARRYPQFIDYIRLLALSLKSDHELGFEVTDKVYFAETSKYTTIPDFLLTPIFLRSVSSFESLSEAKSLLREMNAKRAAEDQLLFFNYTSRHLGTPDNPDSFRRLLIVVPGNPTLNLPEKWVQFGIADPRHRGSVRNVSVVAVMPGPERLTNVYFKDYFRTYLRNGLITIKGRWELGEGDDACVECHKSGVLPIFPVSGSVSHEDQSVLEEVNKRFLTYGPPSFQKYFDATKFGPGLGEMRAQEVDSRDGFNSNHESKRGLMSTAATSCSSCHHSDGLGSLNWPMDSVLISSFVEGGKMPLGYTLQKLEREKLYRQLVNDYFSIDDVRPGILKAWLLGRNYR